MRIGVLSWHLRPQSALLGRKASFMLVGSWFCPFGQHVAVSRRARVRRDRDRLAVIHLAVTT